MTSRGTKYWKSGTIPLIGPDILGDIISEVADIAVVLDQDGIVLSVLSNADYEPAARLNEIEGDRFESTLTSESKVKFASRIKDFIAGESVRPIELNHAEKNHRFEYPVRYSFHQVGPDGAILLLGTDLRPVAEMQQQLVKAQLALERDYEAQRENDTRLRVLMHSSTEPHVFVSTSNGQISDANPAAIEMFETAGDSVNQSSLADHLSVSGHDLIDHLTSAALEGGRAVAAKINVSDREVMLHPILFRVTGERALLCRIEAHSGGESASNGLNNNLRALHDNGPDGIVFVDATGKVLSINDGFLDLIGLAHGVDVRGRNITDFLMRGSVDLKVLIDNAERFGRMRSYATKIASDYGSPRNVEISVTSLSAGKTPIFAMVFRDANRTEANRQAAIPVNEDMQSVVELVGSATLKEIVAESTNVIERMCIETAIDLTMNNRVAAAEMLGLSRQSLYVKLRKLDLLSRDEPS